MSLVTTTLTADNKKSKDRKEGGGEEEEGRFLCGWGQGLKLFEASSNCRLGYRT